MDTFQYYSVFHFKLCLQVEPDDNTRADVTSSISNQSRDAVNSAIPAVRQVSNFVLDDVGLRIFERLLITLSIPWFVKSEDSFKHLSVV